ncbi:MAG TPA: hypothetical protein VIJ79_02950 [Acidobacteriaceae bacterium]
MTHRAFKTPQISAAQYAAKRAPALAAGVLLCSMLPAYASPFTIQPIGSLIGSSISSVGVELKKSAKLPNSLYPADTFTITYADASTHKVVTATGTTDTITGGLRFDVNADPGTITVVNTTETTIAPQFASLNSFDPPTNAVVTAYTVIGGSALTFNGNTFVLSGGFTGVDTTLDRDPASALLGTDGGSFTAFNIQGTGAAGTVQLTLTGDPSYSLGLAPLWTQLFADGMVPAGGLSTTTQIDVAGTLDFNSTLISFSGTLDDTATFFDDGSTTDTESLNLSAADGPITGSFSGSGTPSLRPVVPEPSTLRLLGLGLVWFGSVLGKPMRARARSRS